jgi:hypothetical protein
VTAARTVDRARDVEPQEGQDMDERHRLDDLQAHGRMTRIHGERGWLARPGDVVSALARQGYQEYKHEVTRSGRDRQPTGGVWQGLNTQTGSVASAIWVSRPEAADALVFIDIDGRPLTG